MHPRQGDPERLSHRVAAGAPQRLDNFLHDRLPALSRQELREAIASGAVRVNGRRARKGDTVRDGDIVSLPRPVAIPVLLPNTELAVEVLYLDGDVLALNKPAGMPSLAQRSSDRATVANFLAARFPETLGVGERAFECGVAHRLDNATSGALLVARHAESYRKLRQTFREKQVEKIYLAVVRGEIAAPQTLTTPLRARGRHGSRVEVAACGDCEARAATTELWPLQHLADATLLRIRIATGVRHQIRAHLASIGHPVLGDPLYHPGREASARLLLHAVSLRLPHPTRGDTLLVEAPPPGDFQAALAGAPLPPSGDLPPAS